MQRRISVWFLVVWLAACGGSPPANEGGPTDATPTLSNPERIATIYQLSTQQAQLPTPIPPTPTPTVPVYDPGPYFTPQRPPPLSSQDFVPPEQVEDFTRRTIQGQCHHANGQVSNYASPDQERIQLMCLYTENAREARLALREGLTHIDGAPLLYVIQGDKSFFLAASGGGFIYAWTNGPWFFSARSSQQRTTLDAFMQAFPY